MKETLSPFHTTILIFMTQSGIVMFSLPQTLAFHFGTNGWVALIVVWAFVSLNIGIIGLLYRMTGGRSMVELLSILPKAILYPLCLFIMATWAVTGCLLVKQYVLIFQMIAFPSSNPMILKFVVDLLLFSLLIKGIYNISKAATIFFWMIIWTVLFIFYFIPDFQWARLTPFVFQEAQITADSWRSVYAGFLGYELCLLLFPYSDSRTKLIRSTMLGHGIVTLKYLVVTIICFGFFSLDQLKSLRFPVIEIFSYVQLPVVQAINSLVFSVFLLSVILTAVMYCWAAKELTRPLFRLNDKLLSFLIVFAAFGISFLPQNLSQMKEWLNILLYVDVGIAVTLPLILILLSPFSRTRNGGKSVSE